MTSTVRSVRVVMEADVAGYIAAMKLAGRETDAAFGSVEKRLAATNSELGATDKAAAAVSTTMKKTSADTDRVAASSTRLGASLNKQTGEITGNTRALVAKSLADQKALSSADRLGVSLTDVTDAALGNRDALTKVNQQLEESRTRLGYVAADEDRVRKSILSTNTALGDAQSRYQLTSRAIGDTREELEKTAPAVDRVGASSRRNGAEIDKLSGRFRVLADAALTLGPVLIPIGGAALPALTAALGGLGAAAGGIGVAVLALHGIADGLKAIDAYQLDPTAANLAKLRLEMQKLGPAGARFVSFLDSIEPKLSGLQKVARNGLFPGTEAGITDLLTRLPEVRQVVNRLSREMGHLAEDSGAALAGDAWTPFFTYVKQEAAPTLDAFARSTGNVALGFANLLVAFQPLTDRFTGGMLEMTKSFAEWSKGLDDNQGFQSFLAYIEKTGPEVLHLIGGLADAFAGIVHAAAPLGETVLPALTALVKVFAAVANSPIGPALYTALAASRLYARGADLATRSTVRLNTAMNTMSRAQVVRGAAGGLGLLALSLTDVDNKVGLANTSMDAMAGLMVGGPWGAAIGAGIGAMMDLRDASDRAASSQDQLDKAFARSSASYVDRVNALKKANDDYLSDVSEFQTHGWSNFLKHPMDQLNYALSSFDGTTWVEQLGADASSSQLALDSMNKSLIAIGTQLGNPAILAGARDFDTLNQVAASIQPALSALGLSLNDLSVTKLSVFGHTLASNGAEVRANRDAIVDWVKNNDSAAGRSQALTDAVSGLNNQLLSTAQSANAVSEALNNLLGPQLNLSEATDAWTTALRHLSDDLDANNHSIVGNSDAAIKNRGAIRDRVTAMTDVLSAEAAAGASSGKLTRSLQSQRQALINAGDAANISKSDMKDYLNVLGLTPKLVKTLIQANADQAKGEISAVQRMLSNLHDRDLYIRIHTVGGNVGSHGDPGLPDAHGGAPIAKHSADGSMVPKGGVYADRYLYKLAPGEEIISNRHGQADQFRADRAAGRIPGYAAGGTIPGPTALGPQQTVLSPVIYQLGDGIGHVILSLKELQKAADKVSAAYDKEKSKLDAIDSAMDSLSSTIASKFSVDLSSSGSGVSIEDLIAQGLDPATAYAAQQAAASNAIPNQIAAAQSAGGDASQMPSIIAALQAAGVSGAALEQILSEESFANLVALSQNPALASQLASSLTTTHGVANAGGHAGAQAVYGDERAVVAKHLAALNDKAEKLNEEIKELKQIEKEAPAKVGQAAGQAAGEAVAAAGHQTAAERARRQRGNP